MKILILCDKFKGTLSSGEAGAIIKKSLSEKYSGISENIEVINISDGGEGFMDAFVSNNQHTIKKVKTLDPLRRNISISYAVTGATAVIESSLCIGLSLLDSNERNPMHTTTYGLGCLLRQAAKDHLTDEFLIGIGGSATNDGGAGMMAALGARFYSKNKVIEYPRGYDLADIDHIDIKDIVSDILTKKIIVCCDVKNTLYGENGAAFVYAAQKGADKNEIDFLDRGLLNYSQVIKKDIGIDVSNIEGGGAAGGLAAGFYAFLNGRMESGFEIINRFNNIEEKIKTSDIIITGEGCIDLQTLNGKVPFSVYSLAKKYNKRCIITGGCINNKDELTETGMEVYYTMETPPRLPPDKKTAAENLYSLINKINI